MASRPMPTLATITYEYWLPLYLLQVAAYELRPSSTSECVDWHA